MINLPIKIYVFFGNSLANESMVLYHLIRIRCHHPISDSAPIRYKSWGIYWFNKRSWGWTCVCIMFCCLLIFPCSIGTHCLSLNLPFFLFFCLLTVRCYCLILQFTSAETRWKKLGRLSLFPRIYFPDNFIVVTPTLTKSCTYRLHRRADISNILYILWIPDILGSQTTCNCAELEV